MSKRCNAAQIKASWFVSKCEYSSPKVGDRSPKYAKVKMTFRKRLLHNTCGRGTIGSVQRNGRPKFDTSTPPHLGTSALLHFVTSAPRHFDTSRPRHFSTSQVLMGCYGKPRTATGGHARPWVATGRHGRPREDTSSFRHLDTSASMHFNTSAPRHVRGCFSFTFLAYRSMIAQFFHKVFKPLQNQAQNNNL